MNLKEAAIGNIQKIMSDFVDNEKLSDKRKKEIASYISVIAVNAFRLGYQTSELRVYTEEEFNTILYSKNLQGGKLREAISELVFQVRI